MCKASNYICTQPPTANLCWEYFRLQSQSLHSSMQISYRKIFLRKQELWQHNTSHSKLWQGVVWLKRLLLEIKVSVVQFHDHSYIRQCKHFQMFLSCLLLRKGIKWNMVSKWRARRGIPLHWADCSNTDGHTVLSPPVALERMLGKDVTVLPADGKGHYYCVLLSITIHQWTWWRNYGTCYIPSFLSIPDP